MNVDDLYFSVCIYAVSSHMFMHTWSSAIGDDLVVMIIGDGGLFSKITLTSKWYHMHIESCLEHCIHTDLYKMSHP